MTLRDSALADLASLCLNQPDDPVWEEFVRRLQPLVAGVVVKTCRRCGVNDVQTFDDLIQEVFLKISKDYERILQVAQTKEETSFYGYMKVIAANVVFDHYKYRVAGKRSFLAEQDLDQEVPVKATSDTNLVMVDVQRIMRDENVPQRDQSIFWLYYRQGFSASEIAKTTGSELGVKGVESCIYRLTSMLRDKFTTRATMKGGEC